MKLLATLALFAASFMTFLLGRMRRDAGGRHDTTWFCVGGVASIARLVLLAVALLAHSDVHHGALGTTLFCLALGSTYALVLFSYSFPFNRRPPLALVVGAAVPALGAALVPHLRLSFEYARYLPGIGFVPLLVLANWFQHRNGHEVERESGRAAAIPIRIVQASIIAPWIVATVVMGTAVNIGNGLPPPSTMIAQGLLNTMVMMGGIGFAVFRYHLLDIRVMAYELVMVTLASAIYSGYLVYGAAPLFDYVAHAGGVTLAAAAVTSAPPIAIRAVWTVIRKRMHSVACAVAQKHPPRHVVGRVIQQTGRLVEPGDVLASVTEAMREVLPGRVWFLRAEPVVPGEHAEAPEALVDFAQSDPRRFFHRAQAPEMRGDLVQVFDELGASLIVPVRRGRDVYGFYATDARSISRDPAHIAATLADQLAIKLENFALYTEAARKSRELDEARRFLENLVGSLPVGVVVLDRARRVREWNHAIAARSGVASRDAIGRTFEDIAPLDLQRGVAHEIIEELRREPNKVVHRLGVRDEWSGNGFVDLTVAPFRDREDAPEGVVVITQDATDRIRLGRELEESRRLASLGAFAAAIAHDIRTPLTSIQMNVQILRSRQCLSDSDKEYLEIAVEEIDRLNHSVGEILDYAKPLALAVAPLEVAELIDDAIRTVQPLFDERGIAIARTTRDGSGSQRIAVDARRMRQVLVNLLDNAAVASARGATVDVRAARGDDGRVLIEVVDHGRGIEPAHLDRVFEPFFTTRPDGTGLGLASASKIAKAHGGEITVASEPLHGSTFTVRLAPASHDAIEPVLRLPAPSLSPDAPGIRPAN